MKKTQLLLLGLIMTVFLAACGASSEVPTNDANEEVASDKQSVGLYVGGLGDMSFSDSAYEGIQRIEEDYNDVYDIEVIEFGYDYSSLETEFLEGADRFDILLLTSQFVDSVKAHAEDYPEVKFILYGTAFPFEEGNFENVYSMLYRSNEASYLAGYLDASVSDSGQLGFLGGMDNNIINDFFYGYAQGVQAANEDASIMVSYSDSFEDTARGKELSLAMYANGASSIFSAAGPVGLGVAEAALEATGEKMMIGVDSDQAALFEKDERLELADRVSTSVLTNVGNTIYRALELDQTGELVYGEVESLGLADGAVGLAKNERYEAYFSDELKSEITTIEQQIAEGEIAVESVYDLKNGISEVREAVAP